MSKTMMIVGFGPGTSTAVAEKFGKNGFSLALVGRNEDRLKAGAAALKTQGIEASVVTADASDPASIRAAVRTVRSQLGPIDLLHWNAYGGTEAGDLLAADKASVQNGFDVGVFGLLAATEEALPDLKQNAGALLVSNGALGVVSPGIDAAAVNTHSMGLALSSAAKNKLVGMLAERLKSDGIYVGEVIVFRTIKGTPSGDANSVDPADIADQHWRLYQSRSETRAEVK